MVKIIYNRLDLIFFFICFFYNILLFRTNNIVVCQYSSFYTNKSEEELANQYVEDFKKDWRVDQYNICFKNNNFIKLLIEKFSQLSLLEIANVKSFFLLSKYKKIRKKIFCIIICRKCFIDWHKSICLMLITLKNASNKFYNYSTHNNIGIKSAIDI